MNQFVLVWFGGYRRNFIEVEMHMVCRGHGAKLYTFILN